MISRALLLGCPALSLTACDQAIRQTVNVDNGKQTELISKLVDRIPGAAPVPSGSAVPATSAATASQPSSPAPVVSVKAGFEVFQNSVPLPEDVKGYLRSDIQSAAENWKIRYEKSKAKPFEVIKMAADAMLLGSDNYELFKALARVISAEPAQPFSSLDAFLTGRQDMLKSALTGSARTMYGFNLNTRTGKYDYSGFADRKLSVVMRTSSQEFVPVANPEELAPESPAEGQTLALRVRYAPSISGISFEYRWVFEVAFENGAWKLYPESFLLRNGDALTQAEAQAETQRMLESLKR